MPVILSAYVTSTSASDISYTNGESVGNRLYSSGSTTLITQAPIFNYFTAQRTETVGFVTTFTAGTAAAALTYAAVGVYSVDGSGNLTKIFDSGDLHATLWASTFAVYNTPLTSTFTKVAGTKYAVAMLAVGTTPPSLASFGPPGAIVNSVTPVLQQGLTGQATLPASVPQGTLGNGGYSSVIQAIVSTTSTP